MRTLPFLRAAALALAAGAWVRAEGLPARIWGVTVDRVDPEDAIVEAILALPRRMTVRVVLDNRVPADTYGPLIRRLSQGADLMAELADSYDMKNVGLQDMKEKTTAYLDAYAPQVAIWEVGNEVNGNWLGPDARVAEKVAAAFDLVKARGGRTALTLFYGRGPRGQAPPAAMEAWSKAWLPERVLKGVDYVFVSYYRDADPRLPRPDWPRIFRRLGKLFPNSLLGIGESGASKAERPAATLRRTYGLKVDDPRFVGGCFWWTFATDMVPRDRELWKVLAEALAAAP